jgi:hypothetical protein
MEITEHFMPQADVFTAPEGLRDFDEGAFQLDMSQARAAGIANVMPAPARLGGGGFGLEAADDYLPFEPHSPALTEFRGVTVRTENTEGLMQGIRFLGVNVANSSANVFNGHVYGSMTINVDMGFYPIVHSVLSGYGEIVNEWVSTQSLDEEIFQTGVRLGALYDERDRLISYNRDASQLRDVIHLNDRITSVLNQIDALEGQMNGLQSRSGMSNVTIQANPLILSPAPAPEALGERVRQGFNNSVRALGGAAERVIVFTAGAFIPFLLAAAAGALIWAIVRRRARKGRRV